MACAVLPFDKPAGWDKAAFPDTALHIVSDDVHWSGPTLKKVILPSEADYAAASNAYVVSADRGPVTLGSGMPTVGSSAVSNIKWYMDGTEIAGANGPTVTADGDGVYQIEFSYDDNGKLSTHRLPARRVVIGSAPAFADDTVSGDEFAKIETGRALNQTFQVAGGTRPILIDVVNPLPADIAATTTADAVTLAGTLPSAKTTTVHPFILTATNDFAFWAVGVKPAVHVYRAAVHPSWSVKVGAAAKDLGNSATLKDKVEVEFKTTISTETENALQQNGLVTNVIIAVSDDDIEPRELPEHLQGGMRALVPSFGVETSTENGDILVVLITALYDALSADLPSGWLQMSNEEKAAWLSDNGDGNAVVFAYEYAAASDDATANPARAATSPTHVIGASGTLSWSDAIALDIVTIDTHGNLTLNYIAAAGTGDPFVAGDSLAIPDNEPNPGYLTDPVWLLRVPASGNTGGGSGGVGCASGAGIFVPFALLALAALVRRRRP